jgi:hypothetical protein
MMRSSLAYFTTAGLLVLAAPSRAQEYVVPRGMPGAYDGYYDYDPPVPPRPVPHHAGTHVETVVTTTRRIVSKPDYSAYAPPTVVTTRRLEPMPAYSHPVGLVTTGRARHIPSLPPRRITKDVVFAPSLEGVGEPQRLAPAPQVVIEERRVETIRRIIRPAAPEWD